MERKVGECYQWKAIGQWSRDRKDNCPLLHRKPRHRQTERYPQKVQAAEGKSFWNKKQDSVPKLLEKVYEPVM